MVHVLFINGKYFKWFVEATRGNIILRQHAVLIKKPFRRLVEKYTKRFRPRNIYKDLETGDMSNEVK